MTLSVVLREMVQFEVFGHVLTTKNKFNFYLPDVYYLEIISSLATDSEFIGSYWLSLNNLLYKNFYCKAILLNCQFITPVV